jgi:hypothetical protein
MKKMNVLLMGLVMLVSMPMMLLAQTPVPTPDPDITPEVTPEIESVTIEIEASEGQEIDPPIMIELPDGWVSQNSTIVIQDLMGLQVLPFTIYAGLINEGTGIGYITLLWGFDNVALLPDADSTNEVKINPFMDGLRLLRLALLEPECTVGTDVEREYPIGDQIGYGTGFAAVGCPKTEDTRGWFVSLNVDGLNFAFYIYAEPLASMDGAEGEFQAILDTVRFDIPGFLARAQAEATPEATPEITPEATP